MIHDYLCTELHTICVQISKRDCAVWLITFFGCLTISIDLGLAMGVVTSLLLLVHRIACPAVSVLAQLPQSVAYRPVGMYDLQVRGLTSEGAFVTFLLYRTNLQNCFAATS